MIRVIYMGTPEYAVPTLTKLAARDDVEVSLVVTQPDRRQGRGRTLQSPPVKVAADELELPVLQAASLRDPEARARLDDVGPDLIVVAAFGLILGSKTLSLPRLGCVNLHASLLPAYRGANPIAAAIANREPETGVTLMQMDRGLDTGDIIAMRRIAIAGDDTTASLTPRLADLGANLLAVELPGLIAGSAPRVPQPSGATLTRPMVKNDGWIDWARPAQELEAHVRAMDPWPGAWTTLPDGERLLVHRLDTLDDGTILPPGSLSIHDGASIVATASGQVKLGVVQLPGGKQIEGRAMADRLVPFAGQRLGSEESPAVPGPLVVPAPG